MLNTAKYINYEILKQKMENLLMVSDIHWRLETTVLQFGTNFFVVLQKIGGKIIH